MHLYNNNNRAFLYSAFHKHAQSASYITTPTGLCHSTYILFLSLHSEEYSPNSHGLYALTVLSSEIQYTETCQGQGFELAQEI